VADKPRPRDSAAAKALRQQRTAAATRRGLTEAEAGKLADRTIWKPGQGPRDQPPKG
jgi:predicted transcriptional regulator